MAHFLKQPRALVSDKGAVAIAAEPVRSRRLDRKDVLQTLALQRQGGIPLTEIERRELVAFLKSLTDASARKELMLIVGEALPAGVTSTTLKAGGKDHDRWPSLEKGLIDSAVGSISITAAR